MEQLRWVLDHLDDLASDFSVFHRIDDITTLPGPVFYRMAWRLPHYQGVMASRQMAAQQDGDEAPAPRRQGPAPQRDQQDSGGRDIVPATKEAIQSHPELAGIISFG